MDFTKALSSVFDKAVELLSILDENPISYFSIRAALFLYVFFALYVMVMALYRAHLSGTMRKAGYVLGWPWLVIAAIVDVVANLTIFCIIFLEPPRELLVTTRLRRHLLAGEDAGFRYRFARAICKHVLDYFDPRGAHCVPGIDE